MATAGQKIRKIIDGLSEAIVLADAQDPEAWVALESQLKTVEQWARKNGRVEVSAAMSAAVVLAGRARQGNAAMSLGAMDVMCRTISAIQIIVIEGKTFRDVVFPEELALAMKLHAPSKENEGQTEASGDKKESRPKKTVRLLKSEAGNKEDPVVVERPLNSLRSDPELMGSFVSETEEHLASADLMLIRLEKNPLDKEALNDVFRAFHSIKGTAGFLELDEIQALAHVAEELLEYARKGKLVLRGSAIDLVFEALDGLKNLLQNLCESLASGNTLAPYPALPSLLSRIKGAILAHEGTEAGAGFERVIEDLDLTSVTDISSVTAQDAPRAAVRMRESVRIDAERLDRLLNTIGEVVISVSMTASSAQKDNAHSALLFQQLGQLEKNTRQLQEIATSLRMVPIRPTFQKMARLVRDLAKKENKSVEFIVSGEDAELDKSLVEKIGDPLVHLVRNAVDHGIERSVEERLDAGKPEMARVEMRAFHKGGNIHIEVEDDGGGMDLEVLLATARERGIIGEEEVLSEEEAFGLIFKPGFSTASVVTDVSGRGVGLDVVKMNIETLRGQVAVRSRPGKGTLFSIQLPLTLAIIDGMALRVGRERFILPTVSMLMATRPDGRAVETVLERGEMFQFQDEWVPLFRLSKLFEVENAESDPLKALVVVVEHGGKRACLLVDELLGQQQIVIKTLSEGMRNIPGISGGAIMSDGSVGLILDVAGIIQMALGNVSEYRALMCCAD